MAKKKKKGNGNNNGQSFADMVRSLKGEIVDDRITVAHISAIENAYDVLKLFGNPDVNDAIREPMRALHSYKHLEESKPGGHLTNPFICNLYSGIPLAMNSLIGLNPSQSYGEFKGYIMDQENFRIAERGIIYGDALVKITQAAVLEKMAQNKEALGDLSENYNPESLFSQREMTQWATAKQQFNIAADYITRVNDGTGAEVEKLNRRYVAHIDNALKAYHKNGVKFAKAAEESVPQRLENILI